MKLTDKQKIEYLNEMLEYIINMIYFDNYQDYLIITNRFPELKNMLYSQDKDKNEK